MVLIPSASLNAQTVCLFNHRQIIPKLPHQESVWFNPWASSLSLHLAQTGIFLLGVCGILNKSQHPAALCCPPDYCNFPEVSSYVTSFKESNITVLHRPINMPPAALFICLAISTTHHNHQGASKSQRWVPADSNPLNTPLWKTYKFLYVMMSR